MTLNEDEIWARLTGGACFLHVALSVSEPMLWKKNKHLQGREYGFLLIDENHSNSRETQFEDGNCWKTETNIPQNVSTLIGIWCYKDYFDMTLYLFSVHLLEIHSLMLLKPRPSPSSLEFYFEEPEVHLFPRLKFYLFCNLQRVKVSFLWIFDGKPRIQIDNFIPWLVAERAVTHWTVLAKMYVYVCIWQNSENLCCPHKVQVQTQACNAS